MLWGGRRGSGTIVAVNHRWRAPCRSRMTRADPAVPLDQDSTPIAVIEMSQSSGRGAATVPGLKRRPLKSPPPTPEAPFGLLGRWREEAGKSGPRITRIAVACAAGRDGFLGWRAGCGRAASQPMPSTRPAFR